MARGRRKHIIQSQDEYLVENHVEQERSLPQDVGSSELHPPTGDSLQVESDDDVDVNVQDANGEKTKRGKNKLKDIWNLPKGLRIVVACNDIDQPIGEEAGVLGKFLGMVARNGLLCSLSYKDWRLLIHQRERNTNEEKNKKDILKQVKMRFLYPSRMEKWILRTIGDRWRQHKSNLKSVYFDANKSMEVNCSNVPNGVIGDQWIALVNNWMSQKSKEISDKNRANCAKKKSMHTAGTKSFARNREELRQKDPEKKIPHRAVLYIHTHQPKSDKNINEHVDNLKELIVQKPNLADTSHGKVAWKGDALTQILGEDKPGRIHGLGLVPNPNQVFDLSTSRRFKNINLSSVDPTPSEDVLSLRLQMEKFQKHVQNQDVDIVELRQKTTMLEKRQLDQCLDDHPRTSQNTLYDDGQNSKRKRVYGYHSKGFNMLEEPDNTMRQNDDDHVDLLSPNKYSSGDQNKKAMIQNNNVQQANSISYAYKNKETIACGDNVQQDSRASTQVQNTNSRYFQDDNRLDKHKHTNITKVVDPETSSYWSNNEVLHHLNKRNPKGACAAMRKRSATGNWMPTNSATAGTKVFLKSLTSQNKDVAFATVVSCDPTYKLDGVQIGKEFWLVRVSIPLAADEALVRPYKSYKVIGDAVGAHIAWPSTFVEKING